MMPKRWEGPPENLDAHFDPLAFPLVATEELTDLDHTIGQERAVRAMEFGLQMRSQSYNLYVSGVCGTDKKVVVKAMIERAAANQLPQFPSRMRRTYIRLRICPYGWRRRSAVDVCPQCW
jgi:AAA domain